MADFIKIQQTIKNNSQSINEYVSDLNSWSSTMKAKDNNFKQGKPQANNTQQVSS